MMSKCCAVAMFAGLKGGFLAKNDKKKQKKKKHKKKEKKKHSIENTTQDAAVAKNVKIKSAQQSRALASPAHGGGGGAGGGEASAAAALSKVLELISRNEVEFDGVTKKMLLNEKEFQKAMYPLDAKASIEKKGLPTSFQKLIGSEKWRQRLLTIMPQVCTKVESIVTGVKARAAKSDQPLDGYSEMVLRPQILLEAFGREVIKMMHAYGREQHIQMSQNVKHIASIESGQ